MLTGVCPTNDWRSASGRPRQGECVGEALRRKVDGDGRSGCHDAAAGLVQRRQRDGGRSRDDERVEVEPDLCDEMKLSSLLFWQICSIFC